MKRLLWTAVVFGTACGDPTGGRSLVTASAADAWAGSPVVLTSPAFTGVDTLPVSIRAGTSNLVYIPLGPNQVDVLMPQNDGVYALDIELHSGAVLKTGEIRVRGFLGAAPGPMVSGRFQHAYGYASPTGIAYGAGGRLTLADLKTGSTAPLGTPADLGFGNACMPGAVPSADNPAILTLGRRVPGVGCTVIAAYVNTTLLVIDSTALPGDDVNPSMYLGAGRWIVGQPANMVVVTGPNGQYTFPCDVRALVAARTPGIAVVPVGCDIVGGVPVFDRTSGSPQFVLGNVREVTTAAFSPQGDTLYYSGLTNDVVPQSRLYAADPVTGAILDSTLIPPLRNLAVMAADPTARWLYLADGEFSADSIEVTVYDRTTLDIAAIWRVPNFTVPDQLGLWSLMIGDDRVLYLSAMAPYPTGHSYVYRWALIP